MLFSSIKCKQNSYILYNHNKLMDKTYPGEKIKRKKKKAKKIIADPQAIMACDSSNSSGEESPSKAQMPQSNGDNKMINKKIETSKGPPADGPPIGQIQSSVQKMASSIEKRDELPKQPGNMQTTEATKEREKATQLEHTFTRGEFQTDKQQAEPLREVPKTRLVTNLAVQNQRTQGAGCISTLLPQQQMMAQAQAHHQHGENQNLVYNIFVLYKTSHASQKMQMLIHYENYKSKEFIDLQRISFQVGRNTMAVYNHAYAPRKNFQKLFEISLFDPGLAGLPGRNYYEKTSKHYDLNSKRQNMFLMNMQIVPNGELYFYKEPPGDSVLDPVEQLLGFTMFILVHKRYNLFQDMMRDFTQAFPVLPELNSHQCNTLKEVFDAYVLRNQDKLKEFIRYLLPPLGLLPINGSIVANLILTAFAKLEQQPTIDSVRKQLIENPICDHLWYMLLEKYEHLKMQGFATSIVDLVSKFAIMVIQRELTIEEIGKLKNQTPDQQKAFENYLHMAISIKGGDQLRGSTMASYIENIKKELDVKIMQKSHLHAFLSVFMQLDSYHPLMVDFFSTNSEYTKKRLRDYKFSEQLMQFLKVAEKVYFLQYSTIYTQYLDQKKAELGADLADPFSFREACESAYDQLYLEIASFMMTPLSEFKVLKLKQFQGGQNAIGRVQIEREIDIFKKIYHHQEISNNTLQDLKEIMLALSDREQTANLCKSLIEMQSQKCYKKENKVGGMESQVPIFPVNIKDEAEAAQLFVQFCYEGFNHLTADQYMNFFRIVQAQIVDAIKKIVTQETLDKAFHCLEMYCSQTKKKTNMKRGRSTPSQILQTRAFRQMACPSLTNKMQQTRPKLNFAFAKWSPS